MAAKKVSFSQLTRDVVQASPAPLPFAEILRRVNAVHTITTKNPKQTIRNAVTQSRMILSTGDGRFGWKLRLINNSIIRHTIQEAELVQNRLFWDDDLWDAMWPAFLTWTQQYRDHSPARVTLANGPVCEFSLEMFLPGIWGTQATPEFWAWFHDLKAGAGDHFLVEIVNGEERAYRMTFQPRAARDEAVIAARNRALVDVGLKLMGRPYGVSHWDFTSHLLATGFYHHPIPPDPFSELWHDEAMAPVFYGGDPEPIPTAPDPLPLVSELFGQKGVAYDPEQPPDLPREYDPDYGERRARGSRKARSGSVTSVVLRVIHKDWPEVWRDVELAEDNTLEDLHLTIQLAFGWADDHLYSFFLSGKPFDKKSEVGSPWSDCTLHTHQIEMAQLDPRPGQTFLYYFDYGDSHEFDVTVLKLNPLAPKAKYPRILDFHGEAPPQYPDYDSEM